MELLADRWDPEVTPAGSSTRCFEDMMKSPSTGTKAP